AHCKLRSDTRRALHRYIATHQLNQPPYDRKAKAGAAEPTSRRAVGLGERLKQARALRLGQTDTSVGHDQYETYVALAERRGAGVDAKTTALGELQRVADEIEQDLPHPGGITKERVVGARIDGGVECKSLGLSLLRKGGNCVFEQPRQ